MYRHYLSALNENKFRTAEPYLLNNVEDIDILNSVQILTIDPSVIPFMTALQNLLNSSRTPQKLRKNHENSIINDLYKELVGNMAQTFKCKANVKTPSRPTKFHDKFTNGISDLELNKGNFSILTMEVSLLNIFI